MKTKKKMSMYMKGGKAKKMPMYPGGGKMMKGMMDYAMGGKMDKDMMKMYATGGMLAALMEDPKQREMAKEMLGIMEKGGMMKYQNGGMTPDEDKKTPMYLMNPEPYHRRKSQTPKRVMSEREKMSRKKRLFDKDKRKRR